MALQWIREDLFKNRATGEGIFGRLPSHLRAKAPRGGANQHIMSMAASAMVLYASMCGGPRTTELNRLMRFVGISWGFRTATSTMSSPRRGWRARGLYGAMPLNKHHVRARGGRQLAGDLPIDLPRAPNRADLPRLPLVALVALGAHAIWAIKAGIGAMAPKKPGVASASAPSSHIGRGPLCQQYPPADPLSRRSILKGAYAHPSFLSGCF